LMNQLFQLAVFLDVVESCMPVIPTHSPSQTS
jgi:hypothetical protein